MKKQGPSRFCLVKTFPVHAFSISLALLIAAAASFAGCKKHTSAAPGERIRPAEPFIAYYRDNAGTLEIWRATLPNGAPSKWFTAKNTARITASQTGPGASLFTYNPADSHAYYTNGGKIFTHPQDRTNPIADPGAASGRAITALWTARNGSSLLAMLPAAERPSPEFIRLDLRSGAWKTITPANPAWDEFDLAIPAGFCHTDCAGKTFTATAGSFTLEPPPPSSAGWPRLAIKTNRGRFTATGGSRRILAARWTPDGRAVLFIEANTLPGQQPAGPIMLADPESEQISTISESQHTAAALFNLSRKTSTLYFSEQPAGIFSYSFKTSKKTSIDPLGANVALVE